jgi:hypothetical protein
MLLLALKLNSAGEENGEQRTATKKWDFVLLRRLARTTT